MNTLIDYFSNIPSSHRSAILVGGIALFWMIESAVPLFQFKYNKWRHAGINFFFTFTTILINFVMAFLLLKTSDWTIAHRFGILQWLPEIPTWLYAIVGMLLLDFWGAYVVHWAQHKFKWMWLFHLVHHTDTHVDTTSANRHHPGESIFRFVFTCFGTLVAGAPMWLVMLYQSCSVLLSQFNHANISLPKSLDNILSHLIITPDMHKVHHHYVMPYTDSNYGNIFSIWDRIFGTYKTLDNSQIVFGIDTHLDPKENDELGNLLKIPFQPYRQPQGSKFE